MEKNVKNRIYPYMPNTTPAIRNEMMDAIGIKDISELFQCIPEPIRYGNKELEMPDPITNERDLRRFVTKMLDKNESCDDHISFLGGGVAHHYVPAICDELVRKPEWYTTFMGQYHADPGKIQMWWEYQSMICDLVEMELSGWPAQDGTTAAWGAILTAGRVNHGRTEVLIPENLDPQRMNAIEEVCRTKLKVIKVKIENDTGLIDMDDFKAKLNDKTACVYFENPTYLGSIEVRGQEVADLAHNHGALVVVAVHPLSLGVMETPKNYGADIICGELQSMGVHLQYGGGMIGFIATPFADEWLAEYPYLSVSRNHTVVEDEMGYTVANMGNVSYDRREESGDITSTNSALWVVPVSAYLATMGPDGLREMGEVILGKSYYAKQRLSEIEGITLPIKKAATFMEFVVNYDKTGKTVKEINQLLLEKGVFGGHDLSDEFPQYGQSALFCVTENVSKENIDYLIDVLKEVL
ncbi:aminomethyl-transferring glycine dehydrogenase subunit GcvPA [Vagococcus elongatus]|nr:aminomethyl-transferring glycine dehydrogenase subunit GcvPA [Vagococcus elongatus]